LRVVYLTADAGIAQTALVGDQRVPFILPNVDPGWDGDLVVNRIATNDAAGDDETAQHITVTINNQTLTGLVLLDDHDPQDVADTADPGNVRYVSRGNHVHKLPIDTETLEWNANDELTTTGFASLPDADNDYEVLTWTLAEGWHADWVRAHA
jgi:hypothetical protein